MKQYKNHYLISLSYDGSSYHGWVKQKNQELTIQTMLEKSLAIFMKTTDFYLVGASKTDAGVHAIDQKVLLHLDFEIKNLSAFQDGINKVLPADIKFNSLIKTDSSFNLREVKQKTYLYVLNDGTYDVFQQRYQTWINYHLDEVKLQHICDLFVGEHDFFLFSGLSENERTLFKTKRVIDAINVVRIGDQIQVSFQATGFLRYQIRMIMGASLMCLKNPDRLNEAQIQEKLQGIGNKAPFLAPSNGLFLQKIKY